MTDPTPHALGFTAELQDQLWNAERRVKELKAQQGAITHAEALGLAYGRLQAAEWAVKTVKQALTREASRGRE